MHYCRAREDGLRPVCGQPARQCTARSRLAHNACTALQTAHAWVGDGVGTGCSAIFMPCLPALSYTTARIVAGTLGVAMAALKRVCALWRKALELLGALGTLHLVLEALLALRSAVRGRLWPQRQRSYGCTA